MEYIVKQLVGKMEQDHLIKPDQIDSYTYVLQLKIESAVSVLCLLVLSFLYHMVMPTVFFLIAVSALKKRCGGIHANTFAQCLGGTLMNRNVQKKVLQLLQKTAEKEVSRLGAELVETEWPPTCSFLIHQPKRPCNKNKT